MPQARTLTLTALADWQLAEHADDVIICVSELVTNATRATRHTGADDGALIQVFLHLIGRFLYVHIWDGDHSLPVARPQPDPDEKGTPDWDSVDAVPQSGYGLHLVQTLSDGWYWQVLPVGKVIICQFNLEKRTDAAPTNTGVLAAVPE